MLGTENGTNSALVFKCYKVRRNEWSWQTVDIGNMFGPTFCFKNFTLKLEISLDSAPDPVLVCSLGFRISRVIGYGRLYSRYRGTQCRFWGGDQKFRLGKMTLNKSIPWQSRRLSPSFLKKKKLSHN